MISLSEGFTRNWFEMSKNFFLDISNFEDDKTDFSLKVGKGFALFFNSDVATLKYDSATSSQNIGNPKPNDAASRPRQTDTSSFYVNLIRHAVYV